MSVEIERAEAVTWIRVQMARHGITPADLLAAGCFGPRPRQRSAVATPARYASANGQTWDGEGAMPDWLQRAVNAGQSADFFRQF
ncbi:DNA-binding protein (plasmid) [Cupriavidus sp. USMAA2-4]|uniref:H-NS histone family protein n=1 Tax=Cupriavidus sp. USMAA2-4 TaxID=876364 RepID=UPI0008A68C99|nr:H-NS histone family protein [Cupriavidus sp. USMAA2-4]AOY97793.1 DNA-binding protein [Cupriavidus sp. USMAA2-4]